MNTNEGATAPIDEDYEYDDAGCYLCGGSGFIVTCIDDICRNGGECIHGDGERACPACAKREDRP